MDNNKQLGMLDVMSVISFFIGLANYSENLSQGDVQDIMKKAMSDIHKHLEEQDDKIDEILKLLKGSDKIET